MPKLLRRLGLTTSHGLFMQRVLKYLQRAGVLIDPYFVIREHPEIEGHSQAGVDAAISSLMLSADNKDAVMAASSPLATYEQLRQRIDNGHICIVLKHENDVIGYTWINPNEIIRGNYRRSLRPDEAYLYGAYIAPEFRGRGLAPLLRAESYLHLRGMGIRKLFSISTLFNKPAIRFKEKLCAEFLGLYLRLKIGSIEIGPWTIKKYERSGAAASNT